MKKLAFFILLFPLLSLAQESKEKDPWDDLRYFVGKWEGEISGKSGIGKGEREYSFILGSTYLHVNTKAVFEPQEKNPKGEVHEDWGIFSFDSARKQFVLRQFNSEGFFNQYAIDSISSEGNLITLTTESIENAPPGMRARYFIQIEDENEFTEIFELAFPGKDFAACLTNHWVRKK